MSTKLQINSLAAMERLLGEGPDDAMAVEIRKSVLIEYERKHVMPALEARAVALAHVAGDQVFCERSTHYPHRNVLRAEYVDAIRKQATEIIDDAMRTTIRDTVTEVFGELTTRENIATVVDAKITPEITRQVRRSIEEKLLGFK